MVAEIGFDRVCHLHQPVTRLRGRLPHENYGRSYDFLFLDSIMLLRGLFLPILPF